MLSLMLLIALSGQFQDWRNTCQDTTVQPPYNPRVGVDVVLSFCGEQAEGSVEDRVPFTMTVDGKPVDTSNAWLTKVSYVSYGVVKPNNLNSFVTSRTYAFTAGLHNVVINYAGRKIAFQMIGAVCENLDSSVPKKDNPRGSLTADCR